MTSQFSGLLAVALVAGFGGTTVQPRLPELSVSLVGPRMGLTAWYVTTDGAEITERCQEERYANRSVRIECSTARGVSVRIDNVASGAHYELAGNTWVQYLLRPTPSPRLVIPGHKLRPLGEDDGRSRLLALLPADHRQAYVWALGSGREAIVVPSLDSLRVWQQDTDGQVMQLTALSLEAPTGELSPPIDADVRIDRRANRTRLF